MEQTEMNLIRATHQLIVDGRVATADSLAERIEHTDDERERTLLTELRDFLQEWFAPSDTLTVCTSGSTGTPKPIVVSKERMMQSALVTCCHLHLHRADSALLCMPVRYIAGRMMVVRAMVAGLNLIIAPPSSHPLSTVASPITFAAMVPLQVYGSLSVAEERSRLESIRTLIIGGGPIDDALAATLSTMAVEVYATYGMTETLSHIALRRISGAEATLSYHPLPGVSLSQSAEGTLVISAPRVCAELLTTNDVVRFTPDGGFVILGRRDNIINSGGIKIQIEEVERLLRSALSIPFAVTSVADSRLGDAVVLLVATDDELSLEAIGRVLPRYWRPRHLLHVATIPQTPTGKTDRVACRRLAAEAIVNH